MKKIFILIMMVLFLPSFASATTYYVDTDSTGGACSDSNSGTITHPWCTIGKANSVLQAGDTVYLRAGTYANQQIRPSNSGTSGNYITYQNYDGESVALSEHNIPLYLYGNDYINIDGIRFQNCRTFFAFLGGADYNIIQNCSFYNAIGYRGSIFAGEYVDSVTGVIMWREGPWPNIPNNYNRILNNVWEDAPDGCPDGPDQDCDTYPADSFFINCGAYNLIQGNVFSDTSHSGLALGSACTNHNVIRNNMFQNTLRRGLSFNHGTERNLIEDNVFYDHGLNWQDNPVKKERERGVANPPAIQCIKGSHYQIFRRNIFDNNAVIFSHGGLYHYFYHNTANRQIRVVFSDGGSEDWKYNKFKNNIFANTQSLGRLDDISYLYNWISYSQPGYVATDNTITHNAFTGTANKWRYEGMVLGTFAQWEAKTPDIYDNLWQTDPMFTNAGSRDFTLKSSSPMIDAGDWLTIITSSTANGQASFTVDDASYFYDGWGIPGETGDTIRTQNNQITTIQHINYGTNTITVSPTIDIVNGEGVALNYEGSAPDIGAYEYTSSVLTCQSQGYQCCDSCQSGAHPEYDADCPGQVCCEVCTSVPTPSYIIIKTPTSPTIDGDISEFNNANAITLANSRGNSGDYKLMWDDSALYVAALVSDTQLNADEIIRDGSLWNDDSIEIMFDTLHDAGLSMQSNDYKFFVNVLNIQTDSQASDRSWNMNYISAVTASGTVNNNGDTDTGYTIEMAIPWSEWGVSAPTENDVWGFELVMNDQDETDTRIYTAWSNTGGGGLNIPDKWGDIIFSAGTTSCGAADTNSDSEVDILEIMAYITEWKAGNVVITDLMIGIGEWKNGC